MAKFVNRLPLAAILAVVAIALISVATANEGWTGTTQIVVDSDYAKLAETLHKFPHISFWEADTKPVINTDKTYIESIILFMVPFMVIGALFLFAFFLVFFIRCCGFCGGSKPVLEATTAQKIVIRIALFVMILELLFLAGCGVWGTTRIDRSVPDLQDKVETFTGHIYHHLQIIVDDVKAIPLQENGLPTPPPFLYSMYNDSKKTYDDYKESKDAITGLEITRDILVLLIFAFVVLATIVGMFSVCFGWKTPALCFTIFLWLALVLVWGTAAVHLSGSVLIADTCETIDEYLLKDKFNNSGGDYNQTAVIEYYMYCANESVLPNDMAQLKGQAYFLMMYTQQMYEQAVAEKNQTEIEKWQPIYGGATKLWNDTEEATKCDESASTYTFIKEETCSHVLLGTFVIMASAFFLGLVGPGALVVGLMAHHRLSKPHDYLQIGGGTYEGEFMGEKKTSINAAYW